jgi:hypothetical protein
MKGREAAITVYEPLGLEAGPQPRVRAERVVAFGEE